MTRGRLRVRVFEASSWRVRSLTWCSWFSMRQWPRIQVAGSLPVAAPGGRLVTR
ncbi:hypothetical protein [Streptomyces sp. IB201691-2A2]|uniref:hypothetical protein n=1 Tax=Streptomyces sp. IB201691-2A2 TaxID=2561920 RepID=UPI0021B0E078|nr:hypothetical protein [Streptomyces sp. IB201691-2A2]